MSDAFKIKDREVLPAETRNNNEYRSDPGQRSLKDVENHAYDRCSDVRLRERIAQQKCDHQPFYFDVCDLKVVVGIELV
jgi:hypothetical protein